MAPLNVCGEKEAQPGEQGNRGHGSRHLHVAETQMQAVGGELCRGGRGGSRGPAGRGSLCDGVLCVAPRWRHKQKGEKLSGINRVLKLFLAP